MQVLPPMAGKELPDAASSPGSPCARYEGDWMRRSVADFRWNSGVKQLSR